MIFYIIHPKKEFENARQTKIFRILIIITKRNHLDLFLMDQNVSSNVQSKEEYYCLNLN